MSDSKGFHSISMKAGQDFSSFQYCLVTDVTAQSNYVQKGASSLRWPIGILQNEPDSSGEAAEIAVNGVAKCTLGAPCTSGSPIVIGASSFGVSITSTHGVPIGRALYGGSTHDIVPVLIRGVDKTRTLTDLASR